MGHAEAQARHAADTLAGYEAQQKQRGAAWYGRGLQQRPTSVWSPRMTEQERAELAQQIERDKCPF